MIIGQPRTKWCPYCATEKLATDFAVQTGNSDSRRGKCRVCFNAHQRTQRAARKATGDQRARDPTQSTRDPPQVTGSTTGGRGAGIETTARSIERT